MNLREQHTKVMREQLANRLAGDSSYSPGSLPGAWRHYESYVGLKAVFDRLDDAGYVYIDRRDDDLPAYEVFGDCFDPNVNSDINPNVLKKQHAEALDRVNCEGQWIMVAKAKKDDGNYDGWEETDSIGGFVGDDFYGSGYEEQMYLSAMDYIADSVGAQRYEDCTGVVRERPAVFMFTLQLMGLDVGGRLEDFRWP